MTTTPSTILPITETQYETVTNGKFSLRQRKPSPRTEARLVDKVTSTLYLQEENNSSRSFSSNFGQYYSFGENLNGSSGFSQSGGAHHNFYGRVSRLP